MRGYILTAGFWRNTITVTQSSNVLEHLVVMCLSDCSKCCLWLRRLDIRRPDMRPSPSLVESQILTPKVSAWKWHYTLAGENRQNVSLGQISGTGSFVTSRQQTKDTPSSFWDFLMWHKHIFSIKPKTCIIGAESKSKPRGRRPKTG